MSFSSQDYLYMGRALRLAANGLYSTSPNPRVGCVLVTGDRVIGEGFHVRSGMGHAEVNALSNCTESPVGATAYVTLEPCSHYGKTPPCAEALVKAGVTRVVAAMQDPNPLVAGKGCALLKGAGIDVSVGLLETQAKELNPGFIKRFDEGKPYVRIKLACSLDGRTAMSSGESQWITGPGARQDVQLLRARSCAIVTGAGTVRYDNPSLTVRPEECSPELQSKLTEFYKQPRRVVLSSTGSVSASAKVFQGSGDSLLITPAGIIPDESLAERHIALPSDNAELNIEALLRYLGQLGLNEVLVESGSTLAGKFITAGQYDELWIYMASVLMGSDAQPMVGLPIAEMQHKVGLVLQDIRKIGDDLRMIYRPGHPG